MNQGCVGTRHGCKLRSFSSPAVGNSYQPQGAFIPLLELESVMCFVPFRFDGVKVLKLCCALSLLRVVPEEVVLT